MAGKSTWVCMVVVVASASQGQSRIQTELTLDLASKYVWHGLNLVNDPVLQPSIAFSLDRVSVTIWGNIELTGWNDPNYDRNARGRLTELDTTVEYAGPWQRGGWKAGLVDYQYPGTGIGRYQEVFAGIGFDQLPGTPELTIFKGTRSETGSYLTLAVSHSVPIRCLNAESLDLSADLTYGDKRSNGFLYGAERAGLSDVHVSASSEFALGRSWTVTPSLHFSALLDRRLLEGAPRRSNVWFQLGFGTKF